MDYGVKSIHSYIGVTDEGFPIVPEAGTCPCWLGYTDCRVMEEHTCWYCIYADFRKTTDAILAQSICRHPRNRLNVRYTNTSDGNDKS